MGIFDDANPMEQVNRQISGIAYAINRIPDSVNYKISGSINAIPNEVYKKLHGSIDGIPNVVYNKVSGSINGIPTKIFDEGVKLAGTSMDEVKTIVQKATGPIKANLKQTEDFIHNVQAQVGFHTITNLIKSFDTHLKGNADPGFTAIDLLPELIDELNNLFSVTIDKLHECVPNFPERYFNLPKHCIGETCHFSAKISREVAKHLPSDLKQMVPFNINAFIVEIRELHNSIESLDTSNFKDEWNVIVPFMRYLIGNTEMIINNIGEAIPLGISVAASAGIVIEGEAETEPIKLGKTAFTLVLGSFFGTLYNTLDLFDTYVDKFAE